MHVSLGGLVLLAAHEAETLHCMWLCGRLVLLAADEAKRLTNSRNT